VHRGLAHVLAGSFAAILVIVAIYAVARPDGYYERPWPKRAASAAAEAARRSNVQAAIWPSDKYADWLLWKEPSLRGRLAWDVRFELLNAAEIHSIVVFKHERPGWKTAIEPYPVLVLDRAETRAQARELVGDAGTAVIFQNDRIAVLARAPTR
jgi:hypothetical protein